MFQSLIQSHQSPGLRSPEQIDERIVCGKCGMRVLIRNVIRKFARTHSLTATGISSPSSPEQPNQFSFPYFPVYPITVTHTDIIRDTVCKAIKVQHTHTHILT